jgi:hypothetical protein
VKTRSGSDSRERLVEITAAGRSQAENAFPAWQAAQREVQATR